MASSGCHYGNIEYGRVITYSCQVDTGSSRIFCNYYCDGSYFKTASTVYCAGNEIWLPANPKETQPCIPDDRLRTTQNSTSLRTTIQPLPPFWPRPSTEPTANWVRPETTTRKGYYKDPHLEMNVSPAIFVGAVVGGIIALLLIVFAIFFRAHKNARRECRERSMVCVDASSPTYPGQTDQQNDQTDDSVLRGIVQRILSNANQSPVGDQTRTDTMYAPPPYEFLPPTSTDHHSRYGGHQNDRPRPYTANESLHAVLPPNPTSTTDDSHRHRNTCTNVPDVVIGVLDEPPPYEESIKTSEQSFQGYSFGNTATKDPTAPPPPPYTDC